MQVCNGQHTKTWNASMQSPNAWNACNGQHAKTHEIHLLATIRSCLNGHIYTPSTLIWTPPMLFSLSKTSWKMIIPCCQKKRVTELKSKKLWHLDEKSLIKNLSYSTIGINSAQNIYAMTDSVQDVFICWLHNLIK